MTQRPSADDALPRIEPDAGSDEAQRTAASRNPLGLNSESSAAAGSPEFDAQPAEASQEVEQPGPGSTNSVIQIEQHTSPPQGSGVPYQPPQRAPGSSSIAHDSPTVITRQSPVPSVPLRNGAPLMEFAQALLGTRLDHFLLEELIGGGGMGVVFRAMDTKLNRTVAIKILARDQAGDSETLKRFRNEAQSAARLDHQNIARVYYVGEDRGLNYIAFEYIEGVNIRDLVESKGPLSLNDAISYTLQVAEALQHASSRDIVHRDIKPSNVLISPQGRAKLVDMGLARLHQVEPTDDLTASGVTLGTFDYISPEQARDPRSADVRSDIYSLGCTVYFMLTGRPPFPEGTVLQKLLQHQGDTPPDPRDFNPQLPEDLSRIVRKCLAKDQKRRYQTAEALIDDLLRFARRQGLKIDTTAALQMPQRPTYVLFERHLPWMVPLALLIVVVLAMDYVTRSHRPQHDPLAGGPDLQQPAVAGGPWITPESPTPFAPENDSGTDTGQTDPVVPGSNTGSNSGNDSSSDTGSANTSTTNSGTGTLDQGTAGTSATNSGTSGTESPGSSSGNPVKPGTGGTSPTPAGGSGDQVPVAPQVSPETGSETGPGVSTTPSSDATVSDNTSKINSSSTDTTSSGVDNNSVASIGTGNGSLVDPTLPNAGNATSTPATNPGAVESATPNTNVAEELPDHLLVVDPSTDGSLPGRFATFKAACEAAQSGDVIELRFSGVHESRPVKLKDVNITVRAGEGYEPVLTFVPTAADPFEYPREMIEATNSTMYLVNTALRLSLPSTPSGRQWAMFALLESEIEFTRCVLTVINGPSSEAGTYYQDAAFIKVDAPMRREMMDMAVTPTPAKSVRIRLTDCIARGEAVFLRTANFQPFELTWTNGLVALSRTFFSADQFEYDQRGGNYVLSLNHLTADLPGGLCDLMNPPEFRQLDTEIRCSNSIMIGGTNPLLRQRCGMGSTDVMNRVFWYGNHNFYERLPQFWAVESELGENKVPLDEAAWRKHWGDAETSADRDAVWKEPWTASRVAHRARPEMYQLSGSANPAVRGASDGMDAGALLEQLPSIPGLTAEQADPLPMLQTP